MFFSKLCVSHLPSEILTTPLPRVTHADFRTAFLPPHDFFVLSQVSEPPSFPWGRLHVAVGVVRRHRQATGRSANCRDHYRFRGQISRHLDQLCLKTIFTLESTHIGVSVL